MKNIKELSREAKKMITDIKNSGCEACMGQVIKALDIIKSNHNATVCRRFRAFEQYEFRNQKLADKMRKILE